MLALCPKPVYGVRRGSLACLLVCSLAAFGMAARAQEDPLNKVHVPPPGSTAPTAGAPAGAEAPAATGAAALKARPGAVIRMNVDLVLIPITVTDPMNRLVTGLEKEDFQIYENNGEQKVVSFASEDAPVSIGIIFDLSGSMNSKLIRARESILQFIKTANPEDEFFVIGFNDRRGTRWKLCAIPLGGYVKFVGDMNATSQPDQEGMAGLSDDERKVAFHTQAIWKRAATVFAGPLFNFLLTISVLAVLFAIYGKVVLQPTVAEVMPDSPAAAAGFLPGDRFVSVDGQPVESFADVQRLVSGRGGDEISHLGARKSGLVGQPV